VTHLLLYRMRKPDERLKSRDQLNFVPIAECGAKWRVWNELQPEKRWRRITCTRCRKTARGLEAMQRWIREKWSGR
jgi:hypothetical protein